MIDVLCIFVFMSDTLFGPNGIVVGSLIGWHPVWRSELNGNRRLEAYATLA